MGVAESAVEKVNPLYLKVDKFFRTSLNVGGPERHPGDRTLVYADKALVTRCFALRPGDARRLEAAAPQPRALVSAWTSHVQHQAQVTVCISTLEDTPQAARALVELAEPFASAHQGDRRGLQFESVQAEALSSRWLDVRFRRLLGSLRLDPEDAKELIRRGLSRSQLEQCMFRTWPGGPIRIPLMSSLDDGNDESYVTRTVPMRTLLVPARNPEGLITGLHMKSFGQGSEAGIGGAKTLSEEAPLCCCWYDGSPPHVVALIEGGLKAHVLAHLAARIRVIGAPAGQLSQSKDKLLVALARMEARKVVLFPDAGCIESKTTLEDYFKTFQYLQRWGFHVDVAWWGQGTAQKGMERDDLLSEIASNDLDRMAILSVLEFWRLVPQELRDELVGGRYSNVFAEVCEEGPVLEVPSALAGVFPPEVARTKTPATSEARAFAGVQEALEHRPGPLPLGALLLAAAEMSRGIPGAADECLAILRRNDFEGVNAKDELGFTALHYTAFRDNWEVCRAIIQHQDFVEVNARNKYGRTALHCAAYHGCLEVCKLMLEAPGFGQANAVDEFGSTALHYAALKNNAELISVLLGSGSFTDVDTREVWGSTALDIAARAPATPRDRAGKLLRTFVESPKLMGSVIADQQRLHSAYALSPKLCAQEMAQSAMREGVTPRNLEGAEASWHVGPVGANSAARIHDRELVVSPRLANLPITPSLRA